MCCGDYRRCFNEVRIIVNLVAIVSITYLNIPYKMWHYVNSFSGEMRPIILVPCPIGHNNYAGWLTQTRGLICRNKRYLDFRMVFLSSQQKGALRVIKYISYAIVVWLQAIQTHRLKVVYFPIFFLPNVLTAGLLQIYGIPYICRISGNELTMRNPLTFMLRIALIRRATAIICLNKDSMTRLTALGVQQARLKYLGNPVDTDDYQPPTKSERVAKRAALGIVSDSVLVIGTVGTVCERKGILELIKATSKLNDNNIALFICGPRSDNPEIDPIYVETCDACAKTVAADVTFVGRQSDVRSFLLALDIFVLPSYAEGMPNSLLEAMATGLPIVASNIPGVSDIITSPEIGILVSPKDVEGLAAALKQLLDDDCLRNKLGTAARERVMSGFSTKVVDYEYRLVLSNPG